MIYIILFSIFHSLGLILFITGLQGLIFFLLTPFYELWKKKKLKGLPPFKGKVSILIPAYNEEKTIRRTVESVLSSHYGNMEIIVINDGSTDRTEEVIRDYIDAGKIKYIKQPNGGKAKALNRGIALSSGDVIIYTDADSIFLEDTIHKMVRWFSDPSMDAVCGNDAPLSRNGAIQKFLLITTHIGTGFVRRALSLIGCLPIITGNLGAIRKSVLQELGGFRDMWGEDLEITLRLHRAGKKVIFDPSPMVLADCPGSIKSLWNQRVRWIRSYIKITLLYRDMFFNHRFSPFSYYLPVNFFNMTIIPIFQVFLVFIIPWIYMKGYFALMDTGEVLSYLGMLFFLFIAIYSILLDRSYRDLIYLPYGILLILPLSYFYNMVVIYSWWQELRQKEEEWVKIAREEISDQGNRGVVLAGFVVVLIFSASFYLYMHNRSGEQLMPAHMERKNASLSLAISTHFDSWNDWRKAITRILDKKDRGVLKIVGIGAGRPEWTYFKWRGHKESWSNHQKGTGKDMLLTAARAFKKAGYKVAVIIDMYGPKYVQVHPEDGAIRYDGQKSPEQVCLVCLVEGEYGEKVLQMVQYISHNYPVDIINLTELSYYSYSYSPKDLQSYKSFSGNKAWPLTDSGLIDIEDPSIWEWKSSLMEHFIRRVANVVHREGKELYVDVPVSWKDFFRNGRDSGLDYHYILRHADRIIVWNYFYLEDASPAVSEKLTRYLTQHFPINSFYISIGLWGKDRHIDPSTLSQAMDYTLKGGSPFIWITPDYLLSRAHWERILQFR